jgi:hypothetical protein
MKRIIRKSIKKINYALVGLARKTPPKNPPSKFIDEYTLGGKIKIKGWYLNNYYLPIFPRIFTKKKVEEYIEKIKNKEDSSYGSTDRALYQALEEFSLKGKKVVIMGTVEPFYEAMALTYGAEEVTILEYNKIVSLHPKIKALTYPKYEENPEKFDIAFSISSFEHDGLGK